MRFNRSNINVLILIVVVFTMGSCRVTKYLDEDQFLVKKNKVIIDDKAFSKSDADLAYNLETLVLQKPNRDYFFIPRELLYFRNQEAFESGEKRKGWVKNAERPIIHSDQEMFSTAEQMEKYLKFSKGYYNAKVYPKAYLTEKKAEIHYLITTEKGYTVRSKEYYSEDESLMKIINHEEPQSLVKPGTSIDETIFEAEKARLAKIMQERGYEKFQSTNIDFKADSSDLQMDIFITIVPPENDSLHRRHSVGQIRVYADFKGTIQDSYSTIETIEDIDFLINSNKFFVKPSTLIRSIKFREGKVYKKSLLDATYSALANLGTYRFIGIKASPSAVSDTILDYNIFLTPVAKPWAIEGSVDLFYNYFLRTDSRFGIGANSSLNNANAFGGGEKFRVGTELQAETILNGLKFNNLAGKIETGIAYPTVKDPLGHIKLLRWGKIVGDCYNRGTTDTELSYSYLSTLSQYTLHSFKGALQYDFSPEPKIKWIYTPINLISLSSNIDSTFQADQLDNNTLLERSLDPVFITGFALQELEYRVKNPVFSNGFTWGTNIRVEQSGLEIAGVNSAWNALSGDTFEWVIGLGQGREFQFSKYILGELDVRAEQIIRGKHSIAGRLRSGVATPVGQSAVIPFIRQFYVGGGNSLRGWNARELGPGSYSAAFLDPDVGTGFFQTGDIVLEANIEYRFPIYYIFEGAFLVDAGNVWTLREDIDRPGAQFKWDQFYNDIAVNYGIGFRINLDFIILRVDFAQKLRYPFTAPNFNDNQHWVIPELSSDYLRLVNFAFGLNYPF